MRGALCADDEATPGEKPLHVPSPYLLVTRFQSMHRRDLGRKRDRKERAGL